LVFVLPAHFPELQRQTVAQKKQKHTTQQQFVTDVSNEALNNLTLVVHVLQHPSASTGSISKISQMSMHLQFRFLLNWPIFQRLF